VSIISPELYSTPGWRLPRGLTSITVDSSHTSRFAVDPESTNGQKARPHRGFWATLVRKIRDPDFLKNPRPNHPKSMT